MKRQIPDSVAIDAMEALHDPEDMIAEWMLCPCCGEKHEDVILYKFSRPAGRKGIVTHTHWGWCPVHDEPVLVIEPEDGKPCEPDVPAEANGPVYFMRDVIATWRARGAKGTDE